jgi:TRAP transporter TAXI family solute receptor
MTSILRHLVCRLCVLTIFALAPAPSLAQMTSPQIRLMTAGDGSAFLPYGQGLAAYLSSKGVHVEVRKSAGSNENLSAVEISPTTIATAFMASAYDALRGEGWAAGHRHENLRALFPMYETSFQVAALRQSGIRRLADLDGRKVGVGPAKAPAELFFRAAAEISGIKPIIVNGEPAALSRQVIAGEIDALWQGAVVPIPSLAAVADRADAVVFGLSDSEVAAMVEKLPALSATSLPRGTYRGQTAEIKSVSAWNFVVANKHLPAEIAYAITGAVLSANDPASEIYPTAAGTRAANAASNRVLPFHPGAIQFYREDSISLSRDTLDLLRGQPGVRSRP